jgi:hypothetical protein
VHTEISVDLLLGVAPLLLTDHHYLVTIQPRPARDYARVVAELTVSVKLDEILEYVLDIVERIGPVR